MAIVRWTPGRLSNQSFISEFDRLRSQMMNLFDEAGSRGQSRPGVFPALNISEDPDNLYVTAELPGIAAGDLNITVEKNSLIVRGERKISEQDKKVNFHRRERESGFFRRVINIPTKVDPEKVAAVCKDGVLDITLPKAVEVKPRQISVQTA